jgi:hypothetical protein
MMHAACHLLRAVSLLYLFAFHPAMFCKEGKAGKNYQVRGIFSAQK